MKELRNDVSAVLWTSLSLFLALSLWSYDHRDPAWNVLGTRTTPLNWCGYFGSFVSDFLYQLFGMSSWVFVALIFAVGVSNLIQRKESPSPSRYAWLVLVLLAASGLGQLHLADVFFHKNIVSIGGTVGTFLARHLTRGFNLYGSTLILSSFTAIGILYITNWDLASGLRSFSRWLPSGLQNTLSFLISTNQGLLEKMRERKERAPQKPKPKKSAIPTIFNNDPKPFEAKPVETQNEYSDAADEEPEQKASTQRRRVKLQKKVERRIANWKLPEIAMLEDPPASRYRVDQAEVQKKTGILLDKLSQFSVNGEVMGAKPGPAVTMFEFKPNADIKISKITELADDLSLALSSESVRIIAPIPGRDVVGIETSNSHRETVYLKDIIANDDFWSDEMKLPLALGREANGTPKVVDLRRMPHLLVAGTTGSGKSVFVVCALTGLLFRHSPKTLRLILIDPKQVDLSTFNDIPHLLMPTICEPKKAVGALKWAVKEMEKRYRSMSKFGARGLEAFNEKVAEFTSEQARDHEAFNQELEEQKRINETYYFTPQPYIVVVVEEFGDLMAVDKSNVEQLVVRLAQMARASGIHLILAMQSPRKDVVTGLIKTNIPGRISFKVASKMDSRIILDESGAERLLARGDMLFLAPGVAKPVRHHGPWVTEDEISAVMEYWSEQGTPEYSEIAMKMVTSLSSDGGEGGGFGGGDEEVFDDLYDEILEWAASMREVSASLIQRKYRIGYPRAARLIETMEREGVIGPSNGSKPRQVLVNSYDEA